VVALLLMRKVAADHEVKEAIIQQSALEWGDRPPATIGGELASLVLQRQRVLHRKWSFQIS
jgi:hypothetical protein